MVYKITKLPLCRTLIKHFSFLSPFFYQGPKFYNTFRTDIANASSAVAII